MKQWNFKMKKLCPKTFKIVINKVTRGETSACKWETSQKKAFCNTNIEKVEILHVLHDKVALLMRKRSVRGTRNHYQRIFRNVWAIYIENVDQEMNFLHDSNEIEIRFPFYRSFSKFWNIFGGLCSQVRSDSKSFDCVVKSKVIQPQPKYKTINFLKFNSLRKRLHRDLHWNQKQIGKCYLVSL